MCSIPETSLVLRGLLQPSLSEQLFLLCCPTLPKLSSDRSIETKVTEIVSKMEWILGKKKLASINCCWLTDEVWSELLIRVLDVEPFLHRRRRPPRPRQRLLRRKEDHISVNLTDFALPSVRKKGRELVFASSYLWDSGIVICPHALCSHDRSMGLLACLLL